MRFLNSLFRRSSPHFNSGVAAEAPFFAIGDLHGRKDLLMKSFDLMKMQEMSIDTPYVFVGDYVDRGPDSAGVLNALYIQQTENPDKIICLMGNHERMMLNSLEHPERHGSRWLRHGGMDTVASFGVQPVMGEGSDEDWVAMRDALLEAMGPKLVSWMASLPLHWMSGNVFVCHAAAHPAQPVSNQSSDVLLWGTDEFIKTPRQDGIWVVHGHTIVGQAHTETGRIAIDTGAYATGLLTCAHIQENTIDFLPIR